MCERSRWVRNPLRACCRGDGKPRGVRDSLPHDQTERMSSVSINLTFDLTHQTTQEKGSWSGRQCLLNKQSFWGEEEIECLKLDESFSSSSLVICLSSSLKPQKNFYTHCVTAKKKRAKLPLSSWKYRSFALFLKCFHFLILYWPIVTNNRWENEKYPKLNKSINTVLK